MERVMGVVATDPKSETATPVFVPPDAPRTPKSERTRSRLLEVSAALFIERGYSAVSMRDVASAAGLTKGAVYGHFRSKGQLLVECIRARLAELDAATDYTSIADDVAAGVELIFRQGGREIRLLEVDAAAAARHDPDVAAGLAAFYVERHERIRAAMQPTRDPDTLAWLVSALTAGIGAKEAVGVPLPDAARLRDALVVAIAGHAIDGP
jgi:AcrR family transcriptional regulator